jgi:hypothetical protein
MPLIASPGITMTRQIGVDAAEHCAGDDGAGLELEDATDPQAWGEIKSLASERVKNCVCALARYILTKFQFKVKITILVACGRRQPEVMRSWAIFHGDETYSSQDLFIARLVHHWTRSSSALKSGSFRRQV